MAYYQAHSASVFQHATLGAYPDGAIDPALLGLAFAHDGLPHHPQARPYLDESGLFDLAPVAAVVPEQGPAVYEHALGFASPWRAPPLLARGRSTSSELSAAVTPTGGVRLLDVLYGLPSADRLALDLFPGTSFGTGLPLPGAHAYTSTLDVAVTSPFGQPLSLGEAPALRNAKKRAAAQLDTDVEEEAAVEEAEVEALPAKRQRKGGRKAKAVPGAGNTDEPPRQRAPSSRTYGGATATGAKARNAAGRAEERRCRDGGMTDEAAIDARVEKVMARRRTSDAKSQAKRRSGLAGLEAENARLRDQVARLQAELAACRGTEA